MKIPADTAAAIGRGHPWVFGDVTRPEPGTPVRLVDPRGKAVGYGLADRGAIAVRVLGRGAAPDGDLESLLERRVRRADAFRFGMVGGDTDCWRVVNGPGDGLPGLVVDRYAESAVCKVYSAAWEPHLGALARVVEGLGWAGGLLRRFGVKNVDGREGGECLFGEVPAEVVVREHGMRLLIRPWTGQKTGTFLDQREHRRLIGEVAGGRSVVNLFAYHGGFSVAAALGGASRVVTVDIAPLAIEDARENFRLNGLDVAGHGFEVADVFAYTPVGRVGLLILDPPSLARRGASRSAATRAYRKLHERLGGSLQRDGLLASASCTAQVDQASWARAVEEGLRGHGAFSWIWKSHAPFDHPVHVGHPEGSYLKFGLLRRL